MRRQHQAENQETPQRLAGRKNASRDRSSSSRTSNDVIPYKTINDFPQSREMMIHVDEQNETILLPFYGQFVPFHVSKIKTVSFQPDTSRNCYMRIIFDVPNRFETKTNPLEKDKADIFLKEVSFRSKDPSHISEVVQQIKTLKRNFVSLVEQEKLVLECNRFKPIKLTNLRVCPVFRGQLPGSLEAHVNGFRYSTSRSGEHFDIIFGNIKHAFFQENDIFTLLHFHLHYHIMVGNKKTKDVQFYAEVKDVDRRKKVNMGFESFVKRVNELWGEVSVDLEFDQPLRELGFSGVMNKDYVFIIPTKSCLVELIESPFVVVSLSEIDLERVLQKDFDMVVVFKDLKKDVLRIDSIPLTSVNGIKEWLYSMSIKYYETRVNMNWREMLKTINDNPHSFINEGGWGFLNLEGSDSDSDSDSNSDPFGLQELDWFHEPVLGVEDGWDSDLFMEEGDIFFSLE